MSPSEDDAIAAAAAAAGVTSAEFLRSATLSILSDDDRRLRYVARVAYRAAIRRKDLVPAACAECGAMPDEAQIHGHHEDYARPLDVIWLCRRCHVARHRRRSAATDAFILSAPTATAASAATGVPVRTAQHQRAVAGISTPTGRPASPTSRAALAALGAELTEIAEARNVAPADLLARLTASVNAGCAMVDCGRAATHVEYTRHGDEIEALMTCEMHAEHGAIDMYEEQRSSPARPGERGE